MKKLFSRLLLFLPLLLAAADISQLNKVAGVAVAGRKSLWMESPETVGKRLRLHFSPDGKSDDRILSAKARGKIIFGVPANEIRIHAESSRTSQIDIFLLNKGDNAGGKKSKQNAFKKLLRKQNKRLTKLFRDKFGNSRKVYFGSGKLSRPVPAWEIGDSALLLDYSAEEYLIVHIVPSKNLNNRRQKVAKDEKVASLKDFSGNVKKTDNGDVFIGDVPMVDQGAKGYCVPATMERLVRYFGISGIDMHKLAESFQTYAGGGTTIDDTVKGTRKVIGEYGLRMREGSKLRFNTVIRNIDRGIPVLWFHYATREFKGRLDGSISLRGKKSINEWKEHLSEQERISRGRTGAHVALLTGYNRETGEVAVSNSWGRRYQRAWVRFKDMERVDSGLNLFIVTPRR